MPVYLRQGNLGRGRKEGGRGRGGWFGHLCVSSFAHGVHAGYLLHTSIMSDEVFVFWTIISVLCVRFAKISKIFLSLLFLSSRPTGVLGRVGGISEWTTYLFTTIGIAYLLP